MITVGFLTHAKTLQTKEAQSAWAWIGKEKVKARRITFNEIASSPAILDQCNILWWHYDQAIDLPQDAKGNGIKNSISAFVQKGGSLFLTLLAAPYVADLGFESARPDTIRKGSWDQESWIKDYPDMRGFGSNQGHPIFAGLAGAVFTWNPKKGMPFAGAWYSAPSQPREGRIIAVERQYIRLNEDWRVITGYEAGQGRILAVGSAMFFSYPRDRFRLHLEQFTRNCFAFLAHPQRGIPETFWNFDKRSVTAATSDSPPARTVSQVLPSEKTELAVVREAHELGNSFFDVGGRRILVMGKEESGVEEIWCHPFRMLRNVRTGFKISPGGFQWFEQIKPKVTIRPESITRVYAVGELRIEESIVASVDKPGAVFHYHVDSNHPLEILVTATADQRIMWPHSENASGSLRFGWDKGLRAFVVSNAAENLVSVFGSSVEPRDFLAGQFSAIECENETLRGIPTDVVQVCAGLRFAIPAGTSDFSVVVAGSAKAEAVSTYTELVRNPGEVLAGQVQNIRNRFAQATMLDSPDPSFNEGYRWALHGTERFLVETPGLGTSLMAGFGTTERGWNGGQKISGRPGYAWYFGRDACWTAFAMLSYGNFQAVRESLEFLGRHQDLNGKILHEMTTSGHVHYDAADSTPLYALLLGRYVRASGDIAFAGEHFSRLSMAMEFLAGTDTDGDHLIENTNVGHGWVEGGKLFPVHTEIYLAANWFAALEEAASVAAAVKKSSLAKQWRSKAQLVRRRIRKEFWNGRTKFYNFGKHADGTYNEEKTILPAVATYFNCTDRENDDHCLDAYGGAAFSTDWGVRIIGSGNRMFNPEGYHYGSVWPLFTGWAALAEFSALRPLQGFLHTMSTMMISRFWAAGYVEEVLHGEKFQPAGVCSHQAWSESMVLQPLLEGMMGIHQDAIRNHLTFRPWFPPHWKSAAVRSIRVGRSTVDCEMKREKNRTLFSFSAKTDVPLTIEFQPLLPLGTVIDAIRTGSKTIGWKKPVTSYDKAPRVQFELAGSMTVEITHRGGIGLVPPHFVPTAGETSRGVRIISEHCSDREYVVHCEGYRGQGADLLLHDPDSRLLSAAPSLAFERREEMQFFRVTFDGAQPVQKKTLTFRLKSA